MKRKIAVVGALAGLVTFGPPASAVTTVNDDPFVVRDWTLVERHPKRGTLDILDFVATKRLLPGGYWKVISGNSRYENGIEWDVEEKFVKCDTMEVAGIDPADNVRFGGATDGWKPVSLADKGLFAFVCSGMSGIDHFTHVNLADASSRVWGMPNPGSGKGKLVLFYPVDYVATFFDAGRSFARDGVFYAFTYHVSAAAPWRAAVNRVTGVGSDLRYIKCSTREVSLDEPKSEDDWDTANDQFDQILARLACDDRTQTYAVTSERNTSTLMGLVANTLRSHGRAPTEVYVPERASTQQTGGPPAFRTRRPGADRR